MLDMNKNMLFDPQLVVEHMGYPDTLGRLMKTYFRYGIASTKLAKVHLKRSQVDMRLYIIMLRSFGKLIFFRGQTIDVLRFCQIFSFSIGKLCSSIRYGIINF